MAETPEQSAIPKQKSPKVDIDAVVIRDYPKVIFFYPSVIVAAICTILAWKFAPDPKSSANATIGAVFTAVLLFNIFVISFEFGNLVSFALLITAFCVALIGYILNQTWNFLPRLADFLSHIRLEITWHFYLVYTVALAAIYVAIWIIRRFYYWEIKHNEIVYHRGLFGDVERHPVLGMRMTQEIHDLLEFLLWRSGRLTVQVQQRDKPYVLENVPNIKRKQRLVEQVTSKLSVEIDTNT